MTPVIPGAPAEIDLEKALGSDAARESFYVYGGALAQLLARLGAYTHHPIDETDYHDQKAVGYPHERMRKDRIPLDPTLRFEEYAHLLSRGRAVCAIIARHRLLAEDAAPAIHRTTREPFVSRRARPDREAHRSARRGARTIGEGRRGPEKPEAGLSGRRPPLPAVPTQKAWLSPGFR